jgi:hypothetical protein
MATIWNGNVGNTAPPDALPRRLLRHSPTKARGPEPAPTPACRAGFPLARYGIFQPEIRNVGTAGGNLHVHRPG